MHVSRNIGGGISNILRRLTDLSKRDTLSSKDRLNVLKSLRRVARDLRGRAKVVLRFAEEEDRQEFRELLDKLSLLIEGDGTLPKNWEEIKNIVAEVDAGLDQATPRPVSTLNPYAGEFYPAQHAEAEDWDDAWWPSSSPSSYDENWQGIDPPECGPWPYGNSSNISSGSDTGGDSPFVPLPAVLMQTPMPPPPPVPLSSSSVPISVSVPIPGRLKFGQFEIDAQEEDDDAKVALLPGSNELESAILSLSN